MDSLAQSGLAELVKTHPNIGADPRLLEALLRDYCGGDARREVSTLVAAAYEHIPDELRTQADAPASLVHAKLARRLADQRGLSDDAAVWAIETWAAALESREGRRAPTVAATSNGAAAVSVVSRVAAPPVAVLERPAGAPPSASDRPDMPIATTGAPAKPVIRPTSTWPAAVPVSLAAVFTLLIGFVLRQGYVAPQQQQAQATATSVAQATATTQAAMAKLNIPSQWLPTAAHLDEFAGHGDTELATWTSSFQDGTISFQLDSKQGVLQHPRSNQVMGQNFHLLVDVRQTNGAHDASAGAVFLYTFDPSKSEGSTTSLYEYVVSGSREVKLCRLHDGEWTTLWERAYEPAVRPAPESNKLVVHGESSPVGPQFTLFVNGTYLTTVTDISAAGQMQQGSPGLAAELPNAGEHATWEFTRFELYAPAPAPVPAPSPSPRRS